MSELDRFYSQEARNRITGRQIRTVLVASTGFFMDAYDIFVINLVLPMLGYVYYAREFHNTTSTMIDVDNAVQFNNTVPSDLESALKGITNVGNLFGQILFGILGDSKGRKSVYGIELLIIILATVGSAMAGSAAKHINTLGFLCFWRFLLGIGIGGDYPMSATVSSEWSSEGRRGQMLALTFSMQGWGQFAGALFDVILLQIFKTSIEYDQLNIDYVWRILFALGILPAVLTIYSRFNLPESARYVEKGRKSTSTSVNNHSVSSQERRHLKDFCSYFSQWQNFKVLLGTSLTWFLLDIAFYGLSLNQSDVLTAIGFAPKSGRTPWETLWKQALGNLIIIFLGSLPGYYVTVFTVERFGRKTIQIIGFTVETILFTIVACATEQLKAYGSIGLVILFALIQFFFQFGANATTFIIPAEVFPTRFRATAHGISAACGKVGAILAAFSFNKIVNIGGQNKFFSQTFGIFAAIQFIGLSATVWLLPETKGKDLDDFEDTNDEIGTFTDE